ncbi:MAG: PVC-type heme-binding CxxCH protein [Rubripirellula sp.]
MAQTIVLILFQLMGSICAGWCADHSVLSPAAEPKTDAAIFGEGVRPTDWQSPESERQGFHLPPGFEIRLFSSEPQIAKPLNMAFDESGRLWVTHSVEYPYPATDPAKARDAVSILQDTDGDGAADRFETFADGLNIPMGVLPYGEGCLCFSIPNLLYLRDTDGDGKCDRRDILLGPFDTTRDTHGMINSLRDSGDGWIHACHGFNNQSQVAGTDGHAVTMHSGNTFRFRPDGSRVELYTQGQVNPFGMTVDEWGYFYSADCHSKPISQLICGACYPSFGRPHDGLGFLPPMVDHLHGSTAISGLLFFPPDSPVVPLREQFISGNVMTSRLNRNQRVFRGATAIGEEQPDFLTSDDPWFRPVDVQMGPDGNIYVADFYNKIIGHYEVPLEHPERDRTSGRIWQIRYTGQRIDAPESESGLKSLDSLRQVERILQQGGSDDQHLDEVRSRLSAGNDHVVRASAELLGRYGQTADVSLLLERLSSVPSRDPVLRQTIRIAVANLMRRAAGDANVWTGIPNADLASILFAVQRPETTTTLLAFLTAHPATADRDELLSHAAKNAGAEHLDECVRVAREITGDDRGKQFELLQVLCDSQNAGPGKVAVSLRKWALQLVQAELANVDTTSQRLRWFTDDGVSWASEKRKLENGEVAILVSSFGRGETYTGKLSSDGFAAPPKIEFWMAGHNGVPTANDQGKNRIRMILDETGEVLHQATPPRNDTARKIGWDTAAVAGRTVRIECVDGDSGTAYAWLAIGRFEPAWLRGADDSAALATALDWSKRLGLREMLPELRTMLVSGGLSDQMRIGLAETIAILRDNSDAATVLHFLRASEASADLVQTSIESLLADDQNAFRRATQQLCKGFSSRGQRDFATAWATNGAQMDVLLDMAQWGWISRDVFVDATATQAIHPRLTDQQRNRLDEMTAGIVADDSALQTLERLTATLVSDSGDRDNGKRVYQKHCAVCHQLRGEGAVVGPQLDGATTRSVERLLEDIVTPDQNVDQAFRTTSFLLDDGRVIVGLIASEDDHQINVVQTDGRKVNVDSANIERRREGGRSLMPSNLADSLSTQEIGDLIFFLRSKD